MNEHTHEEHHHSHHENHAHGHEHGHTHDHASSALGAWKALGECVTSAGVMDMQEITAALSVQQGKKRKRQAQSDMALIAVHLNCHAGAAANCCVALGL